MQPRNRRQFLADVGQGMLVAGLGAVAATELGLCQLRADETSRRLDFGKLEPLVSLLQETIPQKLLPILVDKFQNGTELRTLVSAAALANARTFGGHDYDGYHTFMALVPAFHMAQELPSERRALPVLKVLYRNTQAITGWGSNPNREKLRQVEPIALDKGAVPGTMLREAVHKRDIDKAEGLFATMVKQSANDAFNDLQMIVQDDLNVHRIVLAWRAWAMLDLTGMEYAHTLLRQSVHFCIHDDSVGHIASRIKDVLPNLMAGHKLMSRPLGKREADDVWVDKMAQTVYGDKPEVAAEAVAMALAEGFSPEAISEAISLGANLLVLRDKGRGKGKAGKPIGSVHGDSTGVHASDAANAWRNVARVSNPRNTAASLICGAFHTAGQSNRAKEPLLPWPEHLDKVTSKDANELLKQAKTAIMAQDQGMACAAVHRYGELDHPARPVFDLLLGFAVSEDGSLHAEKYYRTVVEEFASTRPAFRWRHLVGLARVTASEFGTKADGYEEACRLLKLV